MFKRDPIYSVPLMGRRTFLNFIVLAVLLLIIMPASLEVFRLNLLGKYLSYAFVAIGFSALLGIWWHFKFRSGYFLWFRWILHGNVPKA